MSKELKALNDELAKHTEWEYIDPLDLKPDDTSEFSIYNLKSLFANLYQKKMNSKYTTLTVFLIWISKELLEEAYREISIICLVYTDRYWKLIERVIEN